MELDGMAGDEDGNYTADLDPSLDPESCNRNGAEHVAQIPQRSPPGYIGSVPSSDTGCGFPASLRLGSGQICIPWYSAMQGPRSPRREARLATGFLMGGDGSALLAEAGVLHSARRRAGSKAAISIIGSSLDRRRMPRFAAPEKFKVAGSMRILRLRSGFIVGSSWVD